MNLLLDTHVWIWSLLDPGRIQTRVKERLEHEDVEIWLSPVSAWEALMLIERGRLTVGGDAQASFVTADRHLTTIPGVETLEA